MSLLPFLGTCLGAATAALVARRWPSVSLAIGLAGLVVALGLALALRPGVSASIGGGTVITTEYARLLAVAGSATSILLVLLGLATAWQRNVPAALLAGLGCLTAALAIPEPGAAVVATIAAGFAGLLVSAVKPLGDRAIGVSARTFRIVATAGVLAFLAVAAAGEPVGALSLDPALLGLAYVTVAVALALRFGAIPFHVWAGGLTETAPGIGLPLLLVWTPAVFGVVLLAWTDGSIAPLALPLGLERGIVVGLGALSLLLGSFAAWIQDDIEHIVGYSIAQDAGFVLLALGALDPIAWEPARTWIVILVLAKTALVAWVVALAGAFGTRRVNDLAGWAGRAPILGVALVLVAVATIGWPGAASWAARGELIRAAMTDPLGVLVTIGGLSSVLYYGRLLAVGFAAPTGLVRASPSWRPTWPAPLPDAPRSADPGADADGADDDGAATRGAAARGAAARARRRPSQTGQPVVLVRLRSASAFGRARETWRLNRAPIAAAIVLALSIIAFGGAAGTLGIADAARAPAPVAPGGLEPFNQEVGPSPAFGPDQSPGG